MPRTLRIAVVGTTSAGKSTLTNALAGRWLLPAGVQEVSRVPVTIEHVLADDRELRVGRAPASWARSDEEVRTTLAALMSRGTGESAVIRTCTARGSVPGSPWGDGAERGTLPSVRGVRLALVDYPGLRSAGDDSRLKEIRRGCRRAGVVVVTFNAEDTDPFKNRRLIEAALDAVARRVMSRARVVFVLSRFDAFHRDDAPMGARDAAEMERVREIRAIAAGLRPPLHLRTIDVISLAPEAALVAEALTYGRRWLSGNDLAALERRLERVADTFLPWIERLDLARSCSRWSPEDYRSVLRDLRVASGFTDLLRVLRRAAEAWRRASLPRRTATRRRSRPSAHR